MPSMQPSFRTLVVDDEVLYAQAIVRALDREGISCDVACCAEQACSQAERQRYQLILLDHRLPDRNGIEIIPQLLAQQPSASVVMITAYHTIPNAVRAIRRGADDYIVKETSIRPIVERVLEAQQREQLRLAGSGWREHKQRGLLGRSPGMLRVIDQLHQIARSPDTNVLLTGETGVGKDVAAHYLHRISRPEGSPMVTVDCLALPVTLAESLLFGHERGAFTGADRAKAGAFEQAGEGTVFLDEIGDMDNLQGKLLRVLESRTFHRIGSLKELPLRARVIAAAADDLEQRVSRGDFRLDLYQRLAVFPIHIPPLRKRGDDIMLLADHFRCFFASKLDRSIQGFGNGVRELLTSYDYPGNVRELKNIIERAVIVCEADRIELRHLPQRVLQAETARPALDFVPGIDTLESLEKRMIRRALRQVGNVKAEAARLLGISRFQLLRRIQKYGMDSEHED